MLFDESFFWGGEPYFVKHLLRTRDVTEFAHLTLSTTLCVVFSPLHKALHLTQAQYSFNKYLLSAYYVPGMFLVVRI